MRHQKAHRKLGRTSEHRMSMLPNLAVSLINSRDERIVTTLPKAKELRPFVERAITLSRKASNLAGDDSGPRALHLRRQAAGFFHAGNMQAAALTGKRGQVRAPRTAGMAALKRLVDNQSERDALAAAKKRKPAAAKKKKSTEAKGTSAAEHSGASKKEAADTV